MAVHAIDRLFAAPRRFPLLACTVAARYPAGVLATQSRRRYRGGVVARHEMLFAHHPGSDILVSSTKMGGVAEAARVYHRASAHRAGSAGKMTQDVTITWLGSAAFHLESAEGKSIYLDPWLQNSDCPASERSPAAVDLIVLTHGHFDHVGQTMELWQRHRPAVVAPQDLRHWLERQGLERNDGLGPDKGGTIAVEGVKISLTDARHSGGAPDGGYGGAACGCVIELENGLKLYFAGDTCVFGDMQLIGRL